MTANDTADLTDADETEKVTDEAVDEATKKDGAATETETQPEARGGVLRQSMRWARARLGAILLVAALVASAGVAAWLYFEQYRPGQETDAAASAVALDAAKNGTVSLLSYSPESLDKDFAAAKSHLTGDFLSYYTQFTEQIVTPAAKQKAVKTSAAVVRAAVSELHPDSAVVLVFINQNTISKENPDGSFAASTVKVGMKKINDTWLISAFDPV
ncbi:MAG: Mce-associated rane protein [Mycobacterium sp.]|nr:Mce-associated rane protein [Mycobacterium sp.]MDT5285082.1 Mce-associated rane protein [Mycobacterium sp.]